MDKVLADITKTQILSADESLEHAFQTIRQNFMVSQESCKEKDKLIKQLMDRNAQLSEQNAQLSERNAELNDRIEQLSARNEQLTNAVAAFHLVQKDEAPRASPINVNDSDSSTGSYGDNSINSDSFNSTESEANAVVVELNADDSEQNQVKNTCAVDVLNVAFDNEQMFNNTTDANECVIAETEPFPVSPVIRNITKRHKIKTAKDDNNQENKHGHQMVSQINKVTPPRFAINNNNKHGDIKTPAEDIWASPIKGRKRHSKNNIARMRSWSRKNTQVVFEDDDSDFTENSPKKIMRRNPRTSQENGHGELMEPSTSQSVQIVSPEKPEVVFVDESTTEDEDTTELKTMELFKMDATVLERVENAWSVVNII